MVTELPSRRQGFFRWVSRCLVWLLLLACPGWSGGLPPLAAFPVASTTVNGRHVTQGYMDIADFSDRALGIMHDLSSYHHWGVRWMDGRDPHSRSFWVWFTDFEYRPPRTMAIHYRLNMPLFSAAEQTMDFRVRRSPDGNLDFVLESPVMGINGASLQLVSRIPGRIGFRLEMELWPLVAFLIDMKQFDADMEWRVERLALNLRDFAQGALPP